jgi:cytochrome c biogenesis protein CcdA
MSESKDFLLSLKRGQKAFGEDIAAIINSFLLTITYIFGVGLTFVAAKLARKSFLETKIQKDAPTYWEELNLTKKPLSEYYRQF